MILTTIFIIMMIISDNLLLATSRLQTSTLPAASSTATTNAAVHERWGPGGSQSERSLEDYPALSESILKLEHVGT